MVTEFQYYPNLNFREHLAMLLDHHWTVTIIEVQLLQHLGVGDTKGSFHFIAIEDFRVV